MSSFTNEVKTLLISNYSTTCVEKIAVLVDCCHNVKIFNVIKITDIYLEKAISNRGMVG